MYGRHDGQQEDQVEGGQLCDYDQLSHLQIEDNNFTLSSNTSGITALVKLLNNNSIKERIYLLILFTDLTDFNIVYRFTSYVAFS